MLTTPPATENDDPEFHGAWRAETATDRRILEGILGTDDGTDPFVAAVRASRMPIVITNPRMQDNPVVYVNDAFCELTGYARLEIIGRNCRFLQGPDTDRRQVELLRQAVADGRRFEVDLRNYRKDGAPFWNRLLLAPVLDASGAVAYFLGNLVDVTLERDKLLDLESRNAALVAELGERLRAQQDSEARLRFATKAGGLGIWELDCATGALYASTACRDHFGHESAQQFSYADLRDAVHPDDVDRFDAAIARSIADGRELQIDVKAGRLEGSPRWVQLRARVERDGQQRATRVAGTSRDVTEATLAHERTRVLLELDERFNVTDDPDDIAYTAASALGQTMHVSRAGYGTVDLARETIVIERDWNAPGVRSIAGVLRFRDYGSYIEDLRRGATVVVTDATEDPRTRATATMLQAIGAQSFVNMPVTESAGMVALLFLNHATARQWGDDELAFVREVAHRTRMAVQRRRAEQQLQSLAATLEAQVVERTSSLMEVEAALRQSQKMEAVGQLTGGLAHDFNNLLAGISGSLQLATRRVQEGRGDEITRYLDAAMKSTRRAASLTHRLLAFSRRQTLAPESVDVNALVTGMQDLVQRTIGPEIELRVTLSDDLWPVLADPGQLENALLNLCINARDAMPGGGHLVILTGNKTVDARTASMQDVQAGPYVTLSVCDTGVGMPPDVVHKAFEPFFTTKPTGQGTGLGLSMVYGFARQSGGQVRIHSQPDQGTKVTISLPRGIDAVKAAGRTSETVGPPAESTAPQAAVALVIDDEETVRMLIVEHLQDRGYVTLEAADGLQAMRHLQARSAIDVMITDVGLPGGMNGRQIADAARVLRPQLKVLFITGYAEAALLNPLAMDANMHVMTKPFDLEALSQRVDAIAGGRTTPTTPHRR